MPLKLKTMKSAQFPLEMTFHIGTLSNDFSITDANNTQLAYVRQKLFKLKEEIEVFEDERKTKQLYRIKADRWLDFNAFYSITDNENTLLGKVGRKGVQSLWRASYDIYNTDGIPLFVITEEKPWIKVLDGLLGEIPILGFLTGYLFNPTYVVKNGEELLYRLRKKASFFGRKFSVDQLTETQNKQEELVITSLMMMILLERERA